MKKVIFGVIVLIVLGVTLTFSGFYFMTYSNGSRTGELIKFSNKGFVFKTWEGELSQGISGSNIFAFSVEDRDQEVVQKLTELQGRYVRVQYKERYKTFPWWGDTKYFITEVTEENSPFFRQKEAEITEDVMPTIE